MRILMVHFRRAAEQTEGINTWKALGILLTLVITECLLTTFYFSFLKNVTKVADVSLSC